MSVPTVAQKLTATGTTTFGTVVFASANTAGNGIIVVVSAKSSSGNPTALTLSDNNSNTWTPINGIFNPSTKNDGFQIFACTNLKSSPNSKITLTPGGTFSGGAGTQTYWGLMAIEYSNISTSNIVLTNTAYNASSVSLTGQPAGTTAVVIGVQTVSIGTVTSTPSFTNQILMTIQPASTSYGMYLSDAENFPAGTVSYSDNNLSLGGQALIILAAGIASTYSVPDCRNFGQFPNGSRNVNGTLTYDVQTSSNPAVPGTDSRAAGAPVACGTYPQNSRTPGTFGPGE